MSKKFLAEKLEKYYPVPQWLIDISPSGRTDSDFYIVWLDKGRKTKLKVLIGIAIVAIIYSVFTLLSAI